MEGNIADMGQFIGAGLACVGMGGAGIGVGLVAGNFLSGALGAVAFVPILAITAMYGLELMVAVVQAYVFAILTCVYLNDALHPGH